MTELLIGCGASRVKKLVYGGRSEWGGLTTLDHNADHTPDVVHDLENLPLPLPDDSFDEIHAYDVLEHQGRQGDWRFFFAQWSDFWRLLKPDGLFIGICPAATSPWAWGDPSHTRIIGPECLIFLNQPAYAQVGISPMSDFRFVYRADYDLIHSQINGHQFEFVLRAVKPSRVTLG
ncbi:methyltransferase domain-containing protein [Phenylobacterium sp.]|uniref:methyltransferase domain-containing protein n=1 Tax=Phenylobacterium sp. TaxID=1871053 RepID=UPI002737F592|nr:methyltransferase domain-containing protein [Phenylobacterium sp.]MDP3869179.1 methyltransferase domain-containing protein [Phenylobacterium sp.]